MDVQPTKIKIAKTERCWDRWNGCRGKVKRQSLTLITWSLQFEQYIPSHLVGNMGLKFRRKVMGCG